MTETNDILAKLKKKVADFDDSPFDLFSAYLSLFKNVGTDQVIAVAAEIAAIAAERPVILPVFVPFLLKANRPDFLADDAIAKAILKYTEFGEEPYRYTSGLPLHSIMTDFFRLAKQTPVWQNAVIQRANEIAEASGEYIRYMMPHLMDMPYPKDNPQLDVQYIIKAITFDFQHQLHGMHKFFEMAAKNPVWVDGICNAANTLCKVENLTLADWEAPDYGLAAAVADLLVDTHDEEQILQRNNECPFDSRLINMLVQSYRGRLDRLERDEKTNKEEQTQLEKRSQQNLFEPTSTEDFKATSEKLLAASKQNQIDRQSLQGRLTTFKQSFDLQFA